MVPFRSDGSVVNKGVGDHFDSRGCISMKTAYEGCVVPDVEPGPEGEGRTISQLLIPRTCILFMHASLGLKHIFHLHIRPLHLLHSRSRLRTCVVRIRVVVFDTSKYVDGS